MPQGQGPGLKVYYLATATDLSLSTLDDERTVLTYVLYFIQLYSAGCVFIQHV